MIDLFFFKQKTAYELRISDWSSDVCSSDLLERRADRLRHQQRPILAGRPEISRAGIHGPALHFNADLAIVRHDRSEEHTSELQSLMRISYAVFCLKKKK